MTCILQTRLLESLRVFNYLMSYADRMIFDLDICFARYFLSHLLQKSMRLEAKKPHTFYRNPKRNLLSTLKRPAQKKPRFKNLITLAKRRASPGYARNHGFCSSGFLNFFLRNLFCLDFIDSKVALF